MNFVSNLRFGMNRSIIIIVLTMLLLIMNTVLADTHMAASCSYDDVNKAYTASSVGDTVSVPAGACDWGANYLTISKAIKLVGAGTSEAIGTRITGTGNTYWGLIRVGKSTEGKFPFEMMGFRMTTMAKGGKTVVRIWGAGYGWRIHGNYFYRSEPNAIINVLAADGDGSHKLFGLFDNNTFDNIKIYVQGSSTGAANSSWTAPPQWGTDQAVFIENNMFIGPNPHSGSRIDSFGGARLVIRYNNFNDARIEAHSACQTTVRGARSYEVYNNRFSATDSSGGWAVALAMRAGSHVITRNVIAGVYSENGKVALDNRRSWFDSACTSGFGNADGTSEKSLMYDTFNVSHAHPGKAKGLNLIPLDGIGVGTGAMGSQTIDPVYIWNNNMGRICVGGTNKYNSCSNNSDCPYSTCSKQVNTPNLVYRRNDTNYAPYHIVSGCNYFENKARPGWTPYTCPHPLADPGRKGSCATDVAGRSGYSLP